MWYSLYRHGMPKVRRGYRIIWWHGEGDSLYRYPRRA